jgi:hypothetical protein
MHPAFSLPEVMTAEIRVELVVFLEYGVQPDGRLVASGSVRAANRF